MNQVVARFLDGTTLKGQTNDFLPAKDLFHISTNGSLDAKPLEVKVPDLKALYFVRSLNGDPDHVKTNEFPPQAPVPGRVVPGSRSAGTWVRSMCRTPPPGERADFVLVERHEPEELLPTLRTLVAERLPARLGIDACADVQVLVPMNRGTLGATALNAELQAALKTDGNRFLSGWMTAHPITLRTGECADDRDP